MLQRNLMIAATLVSSLLLAGCFEDDATATTPNADANAEGSAYVQNNDAINENPPIPGSIEEFRVVVGDRVYFGFDEYTLNGEAMKVLDRQVAWLKDYPNTTIVVEGHADERGTREYNIALGERRANAVKSYLVKNGLTPKRIKLISYGKERPEAVCSSEECWAINRRSVSVITSGAE